MPRKKVKSKWLYRIWDSKTNPVVEEHGSPLSFLPIELMARYGIAPFLILETAAISIFSTPSRLRAIRCEHGLVKSLLAPDFLACFGSFLGSAAAGLTPSQLMEHALAKACDRAGKVMSCNDQAPITEVRQNPGFNRLLDVGLPRQLQSYKTEGTSKRPCAFVTLALYQIRVGVEQYEEMLAAGLDLDDRSHVTIDLILSEDYDDQNWAQVPANGDYEIAGRLRMVFNFLRKDNATVQFVVKRTATAIVFLSELVLPCPFTSSPRAYFRAKPSVRVA